MSIVALSPVAPEPPSPMITSITPVTPTMDPDTSTSSSVVTAIPLSLDPEHQSQDGASSPGPGPSRGSLTGGGLQLSRDPSRRSKKPPPLHTGADWKVVLHLPEIETWLRATSDRVTQLTHSVGQDSDNRHVDVHLVQLKDICEDISDHVEQIHALLETEFSLKLLSYSVNIIVDIRTVQLLWHQLRVSVLVLKERLLQGLQDSNGNFTRQTDILQAFSEDQHQTRLDALTEVDDCGQLTIRCSQDYFSLDCGITAFELSDYSPGDEPEARGVEGDGDDPSQELSQTQNSNLELEAEESEESSLSNHEHHNSLPELITSGDSTNHNYSPSFTAPNHSESAKRPLQGVSHSTEVSPTQPSLPKRAALFSDGGTRVEDSRGGLRNVNLVSGLQLQAELSRSTPSLMDPPDRSKFWLELDSVYPENVSQSYESLQVMNWHNLQRNHASSRQVGHSQGSVQRPLTGLRSSSGAVPTVNAPPPLQDPMSRDEISKQMERTQKETHAHSEGDSDSSLPSPMREQFLSSDLEASGEESDPRPPQGKAAVWIVKRQGQKGAQVSSKASPEKEHWYGSEEFLALPAQLRKTEMLAMKLESLAHSIPLRPGGCDSTEEGLQDVDDWDLTELNTDWDVGESGDNMSSVRESGDDVPSPLPPLLPYRRNLISRFSSTSSSDIAPSLDESIESGPLSDLQSEDDEGRRSADRRLQLTVPLVDVREHGSLVHQLLADIQSQDKDPDVWKKIECFVQQLDGFISWLQEALDSTENWTQPRQELDSLRAYLDTHLSFKLNVDSHSALKESIMEEGKALLSVITCHQSGLKDILHMVSSQWDQLQRQIRRQHGWMLRALRCIQARLLYTSQSHESFTASGEPSANRQPPCPVDGLKSELISSQCETQRAALEQMAIKLSTLQYPSPASRRHCSQLARNNSLQEFEADYQELWDWLMDMDAMVTDSHQLMMSEEQRHHLFKSSHAELMLMESRKTGLLGRAESLKRSGTELSADFHRKIHNLTHTWTQLEKILSEHSGPASSQQNQSGNRNSLRVGDRTDAMENPRLALSPLTNSLLEQLEARIKELKAWLRDTELLIFNSCLRQQHKDASEQLQSFKSLCSEVRARRRGVASVLKLCQKLLQQSQSGPMAEVGPEAEQHWEALQLLSINLERRWEAIVMQALQWQNRLKRELGEQQVPGNFLEPGLVDLHQISPLPVGPVAPPPDDSWEWDETDMTITEAEPQEVPEPDLTHNLPTEPTPPLDSVLSNGNQPDRNQTDAPGCQYPEMMGESTSDVQPNVISQTLPPNNNNIYQVYSLHSVELYRQPPFPHTSSSLHKTKSGKRKQQLLLKSLSKDSSFSSIESLPDLLGGLMSDSRGGDRIIRYQDGVSEKEGGRGSGQSGSSRRSESESGIVSDTGDMETVINSEIQGEEENKEQKEENEQRKDGTLDGSHLALHKDNASRCNERRTKTEESMKEKRWRTDEPRGDSRRNKEEEKRRRHRRGGGEAVEILINGRGILTPADSDSDFELGGLSVDSSKPFTFRSDMTEFKVDQFNGLETPPALSRRASSPELSQGSSLESLLALGVELFPSKDLLHRRASLESCLVPCRGTEGDTGGSLASLGELDLGQSREVEGGQPGKEKNNESMQGEPSSGELSRRTLDLLKRLENIQSPLAAKMTRSVSDMTLRSTSPQRLPASPSLGGRHSPLCGIPGSSRKGPPSLVNESSATASLTELSSTEDSSLGSEDFAMLRNQRHLFLDPSMAANANSSSYRKRCHGHSRGGHGMDEADAASLSLVVNVSCTSACTDEDEDDSDLLSSSTLTLTEEELGVRDGEDEEEARLSGASSGNEDNEDDDEEEMEGSYVLGLEYMKRELQSWIRSPRTSSSSSLKTEAGLRDELQCGTNLSSTFTSSSQSKEQHSFLNRTAQKLIETNTNGVNNKTKRDHKEQQEQEEKNRRNATRSYISQFVDDVENGNVDQSCLRGKDEDDELLREESSVFTKKGESLRESYVFTKTGESVQDVGDLIVKTESNSTKQLSPSPSCELLPFLSKRSSSLVGQLRGELPCHSSSLPSPPSLSPVEDCRSHDDLHNRRPAAGGRKAITIQEKFKFSSFVTEETKKEVRDKESSLPPKKRHSSHSSCCKHLPAPTSLHPCSVDESKKENVHDFVMEIIDMTSLALKSKENQAEEPNQTDNSGPIPDQGPASLTQIRDKVLEHSHRPLHLRKGDFYSYLSLSSHDSDCGEVSQCSEEKSSTPVPYSLPSYVTPTQGLHSPSPELFTSTRQQLSPSNSAPSSKHSSPGPHSESSFCTLDLKSAETDITANGSRTEEPLQSPDIRDEETLFAACTEEVYLGPPLCYSMVLSKKPRRILQKQNVECLSSLDPGYELNKSLACLSGSKPNDSLQYLSQEGPSSKPGDNLSYLSPSKEPELDRNQDHKYFQESSPAEETQSSFSPFLEPCYSSFSTSSPSNSVSASLQGPGSKPEDDNLSSPPPVSSGAEEEKRGEDLYLLCDVAGGEVAAAASVSAPREERSRNEGPPYLNPRARVAPIDSSAAECLADTKTLESNMGAVMTKISVCSSATNPSKEPAATATRINPKINCSAMREADRGEGERRGEVDTRRVKQEEKGRRGRSGSQQEAETAAEKQVRSQSSVHHANRTAAGRSQASVRPPTLRAVRKLPVLGAGTSRIQL